MDKDTLEILVTAGLFLLNAIIIVVFAAVYVVYYLAIDVSGLLQCHKMKVMRLVTDKAVVTRELARSDIGREGGAAANDPNDSAVPEFCWRHPGTGAAQLHPPKQVYSRDGVAEGVWGWTDIDGKKSWSEETPQLVAARGEGEKNPTPGTFVCNIDAKTLIMSPLAEVPPDVMGSHDVRRSNGAAAGALEAAVDGDGMQMRELALQENPQHAGERFPHARVDQADAGVEGGAGALEGAYGDARASTNEPAAAPDAGAATKIEIRDNNPLTATDEDRTEDEQVSGAEMTKLRAEVEKLRAENEQLKQARPGAVVEFGVAADAGEQCPRGWSLVSHVTGAYFNNDYTGETTYDKPMFPAPPEGWSVHAHGDAGEHYFQHDAEGGGTQWHHPFDDVPPLVPTPPRESR